MIYYTRTFYNLFNMHYDPKVKLITVALATSNEITYREIHKNKATFQREPLLGKLIGSFGLFHFRKLVL